MAAFLAGYHPKKTPVNVHTAKLITMVHASMAMGQWTRTLIVVRLTEHPLMFRFFNRP